MNIIEKLQTGDMRMNKASKEVAAEVLSDLSKFDELFEAILNDDPGVRMRAADAAEMVSAKHPEVLQPHRKVLLEGLTQINQQEVQWHVAQMIPRLKLSEDEIERMLQIFFKWIDESKSNIVKVFSMQACFDMISQNPSIKPRVKAKIEEMSVLDISSIHSRAKKLLSEI